MKSLDDVLLESVGKWGWFQVWFFGLVINFYLAAYAPGVYGAMYTDFKPKHHCAEEEDEIFNLTKWNNTDLRKEGRGDQGPMLMLDVSGATLWQRMGAWCRAPSGPTTPRTSLRLSL